MDRDKILDIAQVIDESQNIRCTIYQQGDSCWVPNGQYVVLRENNKPLLKITYRYGIAHGPYVDFWSNGMVASEGQYWDGKQEDNWHFYNEDGTLREIIKFKQGKQIAEKKSCDA
jgi:antitoxin component YwqK of YwqJK toxin-antitoxin module